MGSETRWKAGIGERATQRSEVEVMIEDIDFAAIEVRCQEEGAVKQVETFVNRTTGGVVEGHCRCIAGAGPVSDDAIFGVKNKLSAAEDRAVAVCHGSRRTARTAITVWIVSSPGYGHY